MKKILGLFAIVLSFGAFAGNNDIYNQLLASEGILSGFNFKDVDQHPIGIASIATFIPIILSKSYLLIVFL